MKLKSFEKVRVSTCTEYIVFRGEDVVDDFTVDYTAKNEDGEFDFKKINAALVKRTQYENMGAKVRFVDGNSATGNLLVTVDI